MSDINMVMISGKLADTPKQIATQKGNIGVSFRLKVCREYNGREFSSFVTCKHFGDSASAVLSCAQGTPLVVTGRIETESWDDRNGGGKKFETVIKADTVGGYQPPNPMPQAQPQQNQQRSWYGGQQQQTQQQYGQSAGQFNPQGTDSSTPF